jgi:hypothetical protein
VPDPNAVALPLFRDRLDPVRRMHYVYYFNKTTNVLFPA